VSNKVRFEVGDGFLVLFWRGYSPVGYYSAAGEQWSGKERQRLASVAGLTENLGFLPRARHFGIHSGQIAVL
jgi:hypothetical protein